MTGFEVHGQDEICASDGIGNKCIAACLVQVPPEKATSKALLKCNC